MEKLNELQNFMMGHAAGSYENQTAYDLWNNILIKINELKNTPNLTAEEENQIAEAGRPGK